MDLPVEKFKPDYQFDALFFRLDEKCQVGAQNNTVPGSLLQRVVVLGQSSDILAAWVDGR